MKTGLVRTKSKVRESQFDQCEQEQAEGYSNITSCVGGAICLQFRHCCYVLYFQLRKFVDFPLTVLTPVLECEMEYSGLAFSLRWALAILIQ
jgi:hypothetical protein